MATTNVPKGAGRPAAAAKSRKHAQRTPLPPKKGSPGAEAIEAASCEGGEEAHYAHLDANSQCPWDHASDREKIVEEARAIVPDPAPEKPMGERTVAELRKVATRLLVSGARSMKRGDLLTAILEAERAVTKTAERLAKREPAAAVFAVAEKSKPATPAASGEKPLTKAQKEVMRVVADRGYVDRQILANWKGTSSDSPAITSVLKALVRRGLLVEPDSNYGQYLPASPESQPEPVCSGDVNISVEQAKSIAKADAFLAAAVDLGWAEKTRSGMDQETYGVIVGRGEERIAISWHFGVFAGEECYHSHPARTPRKVINASAAKKIMATPTAQADEEAQKASAHKNSRPRRDRAAGTTTAVRKALPFDPETAMDDEVLEHVIHGCLLTWVNEISGEIDSARVSRPSPTGRVGIKHGSSGRSVNFLGETGYRSVRVSSILSIR